jgi:hypothetical protein
MNLEHLVLTLWSFEVDVKMKKWNISNRTNEKDDMYRKYTAISPTSQRFYKGKRHIFFWL